jgi:hypothetical protein
MAKSTLFNQNAKQIKTCTKSEQPHPLRRKRVMQASSFYVSKKVKNDEEKGITPGR